MYKIIINYKKIKNIYLRIKNSQVYLNVPLNTQKTTIDKILSDKKDWIEQRVNKQILDEKTKTKNENFVKYLGKTYELNVVDSDLESVELTSKINLYTQAPQALLNKWYAKEAQKIFIPIMEQFLSLTKQKINKLSIKKTKTIWGSCNAKKANISLNIELVKMPISAIEAVILHEIAHLSHQNHSKDFYDYIYKFMPDYKLRIAGLKSR